MLYILGGAAKSGKSILSRKITKEFGIPFFCVDYLTTAFHAQPEAYLRHEMPVKERAKKLWKYTKHIANHLAVEEENYLLEGDAFLPSQAAEVLRQNPTLIKAYFLGYAKANPEDKLKMIRNHEHLKDSWTQDFSDEQVLEFIRDRIRLSKYLGEECKKHNLPYIEVGHNLEETYKKIIHHFQLSD